MSTDNDNTDFTPPSIEEIAALLPAYDVQSFIAKGGMGAVYRANQRSLDRPVAIKILPRHFGEDAEFRASFETEAKSMAKLNHPNLIGIFDFGQVDGLLYIIMEMVEGKSLYHSAYGKTIAPATAARIVKEICDGLTNAHKHGILHRDIKPANILLDPSASPKIGDFGLARPVGEHETDSIFGTPGYTAPEVVHNPTAVDESTDIYSVGIILYELLTGKLLDDELGAPSTLVNCTPKFDQIVSKATHPNPAMRYRKAADMAKALEPLTDEKAASNPLLSYGSIAPAETTASIPLLKTATSGTGSPTAPTTKTLLSATAAHTGTGPNTTKSLKTPTGTTAAHSPPTPSASAKVGSNSPVVRNIIIIIALLFAIVGAWEIKENREAARKVENANIAALNAEKAEARQKELDRKRKEREAAPKKPTRTVVNKNFEIPKPKNETPRESLIRLQPQLARGTLTDLPKGTVTRSGRARFYIKDRMNWHQAQTFCEKHGGYLAIFPENSDIAWLSRKLSSDIKSSESVWLGAGTTGDKDYCWIDGTPWTHDIRKTSKSSYVTVDDTEIFSPESPSNLHSFFIEWDTSGNHPGSLKNQLKRTAASLNSSSPVFPAGTITYDNRHFLLVQRLIDWDTATHLAKTSGGTLAVPSNADENEWMLDFTGSSLTDGQACWIGGLRPNQGTWQWTTGEPWSFAKWEPNAPSEDNSSTAGNTITSQQAWKDFPADTQQSGFLIEWSDDGKSTKVATNTNKSTDPVSATRDKCRTLLRKIQTRYEKEYSNNIKGYEQELRSFRRSLTSDIQAAYTPGLLKMQDKYIQGKIPTNLARDNMPAKASKILDSRLEKQYRIDAKLISDTEDLRAGYRKELLKIAQGFKEKGLTSNQRLVEQELSNTKKGGQPFIDYITGDKVRRNDSSISTEEDEVIPSSDKSDEGWTTQASSSQNGTPASMAIDGDPETHWHTPWNTDAEGHPHTLDISFGKMEQFSGIKLTPRQQGSNGIIKGYTIYTSKNASTWREITSGALREGSHAQSIRFGKEVEAYHLRIEVTSSHSGDYSSLAEIDLIP